jgi:hypothetical protein
VRQERWIVLKYEATDIEGIFSNAAVDMIPSNIGVLIDNEHIPIPIL